MPAWSAPEPEAPVYIVGDIHGQAEHLSRLLQCIDDDVAATGAQDADLVFLGDYVDRGEESAAVLQFLSTLSEGYGDHVTCLAGNHEEMLLAFLNDPLGKAKRWLRYGGLQTIASYGIAAPDAVERPSSADLLDLAGDLRDAMGRDVVHWLETLPTAWNSGDLWAVHAGADPSRPMDAQETRTLLWGHRDFYTSERADRQWVVVGHQPVDEPFAESGRIAIDTGAAYGGKLTALRASPGADLVFLQS